MKQWNDSSTGSFCSVLGISGACMVHVWCMYGARAADVSKVIQNALWCSCTSYAHLMHILCTSIICYLLHAMPRGAQPLTLRGGLWSSLRSPNLQTMATIAGKSNWACRIVSALIRPVVPQGRLFFVSIRFRSPGLKPQSLPWDLCVTDRRKRMEDLGQTYNWLRDTQGHTEQDVDYFMLVQVISSYF